METHAASPGNVQEEEGFTGARSRVFDDVCYDIPFGALLPRELDGLLVAGRCASADRPAQSSLRMQATCMATGQAAGTAAALAAAKNAMPREVPVGELRERLRRDGAIV